MNYEKHGVFRDFTVALQGNDIELEFPKAVDKTNYDKAAEAIDYEYRYDIYPIRLGTDSLSYVEKTTEPAVSSNWTKIDNIADTADANRVSAVFVLPRYDGGYAIQYQVRALDDYKKEPIQALTAPYFYALQNRAMDLDITKASRNETDGADIRVTINNFGLLTPKADADSAAWSAARKDLVSLLGDMSFSIEARTYSQVSDSTSFIKYLTIKLSELDITQASYEFTIQTDVSSSTYLVVRGVKSDLNIDFKGFLDNSTYASYEKAVLKVVGDELRIKKRTILASFVDEDLSFTPAAAMFTHTEEHTDGTGSVKAGHSIALYDHHNEPGELKPSDTPSIGFMDTEHNELGNIAISKIGGGQYLSVNNATADLYTLRGSGGKLQYWDAAANSGNGEWRTILSSRMTAADNGGVQWDFTKPGEAELKLGNAFYYKEGLGLVFGSGTIGSDNLSDELKGSLSAKMVRLSSDGDAVLFDEQGLQPTNQKITFNAELINLSGAVDWFALGTAENGSTARVDLNISNLIATLDGAAFNDFYKIEVTASHDGYSDSKTVYKIKHGASAEEANSIVQVTEWYAITNKSTGVTIGDTSLSWTNTPPIPTEKLPYLWNYEVITYTKSEPHTSEPMMIGYRASDGRGIQDVRNYYLVSNLDTGVTTATAGWNEKPTNTTEDMPYLWNYEAIYYTDSPTPETTTPAVIGTHGSKGEDGTDGSDGKDGVGIDSVDVTYSMSGSYIEIPTTWSATRPEVEQGQYLWERKVTKYTDPSVPDSVDYIYTYQGKDGAEGGRNLLLDSSPNVTNSDYLIYEFPLSEEGKKLEEGEEITVILKGKLGEGKASFLIYNSRANVSVFSLEERHRIGEDLYRRTFKWKWTENQFKVQVYAAPNSVVSSSTLEWIKLVRGDLTSADWFPAPEDLATSEELTTQISNLDGKINIQIVSNADGTKSVVDLTNDELIYKIGTDGKVQITEDYFYIKQKLITNEMLAEDISANKVTAGRLIGENFFLDLDTGEMNLGGLLMVDATGAADLSEQAKSELRGESGKDGQDGKDGKGIVSSVVRYQNHTNGTVVPTGTWTENPNPIKGQYLWTRTITTYTDTTSVPTYNVAYQATDGTSGTDGRGIVSTVVDYVKSATATMPSTGWSTTRPTVNKGEYLWTRTTINYTSGSPSVAISNSYVPTDGEKGDKGDTGDTGAQGKGISSTAVTYQASSSGTAPPTGTWLSSIPTVGANQYLWTRTIITYTDSKTSTAYSVGKMGAQGPKGETGADGKGISSTVVTYQASTSGTVTPTGTWQTTVPSIAENQYLWTRVVINYTSGSPTTSYSIGKMGAQGPKGADGKDAVIVSSTAPTDTTRIWRKSLEDNELYIYISGAWTRVDQEALTAISDKADIELLESIKQEMESQNAESSKLIGENEVTLQEVIDRINELKNPTGTGVLDKVQEDMQGLIEREVVWNQDKIDEIVASIQNQYPDLFRLTQRVKMDDTGTTFYATDSSGSALSTQTIIKNDGLYIQTDGVDTANFTREGATVRNLRIEDNVQIGNHMAFKSGQDYTIFSWVGYLEE